MKETFRQIRSDKILLRFFTGSIVVIGLTLVYILFVFGSLPPVLPIFNQLPWGDQRLGPRIAILFPDLLVIVIFIVNLVLSAQVYSKTPLLARMLAITCFVISFLTFLFIIRTVQIVL